MDTKAPANQPFRPGQIVPATIKLMILLVAALVLGFACTHVSAETFDPLAATETYLKSLAPEARAKSDAYFEGNYYLQVFNLVVGLLISWIFLQFRITVKIRDLAERIFKRKFAQGVVFIILFTTVSSLVNLPWEYYTGFVREHHYDLSNLTTRGWFSEQFKGLFIGLIMGSLLLPLLYVILRKWPRGWWVRAAVVTPCLLFVFIVIAPVFIAPAFNTYKSLANGPIRDQILSMARANGVPTDNVYQFDASLQSKRISANVSGAFGTIRVSLNDNLLQRCTPQEIQAVMGHELGHYVLNHVYKLVIYSSLVFGAGFAFTNWFCHSVFRRWGAQWGLRGIDDYAGLPVLMAGLSIFMFFATPINNSIVRTTEAEADIFGLNAARQPDGFASTALKLSEYRKLSPGPWEEIFFYDHPSGRNRILMAMKWKAEHLPEQTGM